MRAIGANWIDQALLMTKEEGYNWHDFKAGLGPIYPGYPSFNIFMNWLKDKLSAYGCIDFLEHHWQHETYQVDDWPKHDAGAMRLISDGTDVTVGTFLMFSKSTKEQGLTAQSLFYDASQGEPSVGAFKDRIVVIQALPLPDKPYSEEFLESYVITDTNYRSAPEPPADILEMPDPRINNSWNTRWDFWQWMKFVQYAKIGEAAGLVVISNLTFGTLQGLYDRQERHDFPGLVLDRVNGIRVLQDAKNEKMLTMTLISNYFWADAWNFICFLPGARYGTKTDEYLSINVHVDAMSLTQDNGSLGALGIIRYFSSLNQTKRKKTLLICIDSRHFIEGFEMNNVIHDPYVVFPDVRDKVTVTLGLEHMGEMEAAEDYKNNTMVPTGRPEYTFMVCNDNDFCSRILIQAAVKSKLQRADLKIDGRPGIHGLFKGKVRAVQASVHDLGVCVIGQAGNWCGGHTQTFSTMQYFSEDKFYREVWLWTQVVNDMMESNPIVYDIVWSKINSIIRKYAKEAKISNMAKEGLLDDIASIFGQVEANDFQDAINRLNAEFLPAITRMLRDNTDVNALKEIVDTAIHKLEIALSSENLF